MFCRRCGNPIPEGLGMCSVCGLETSLTAPAPSTAQPAAAPAPSVAVPPPGAGTDEIGGWLLFFCISLTVLWPLWMLSQYARFHFVFRGLAWLGLGRLALGVMAGLMLWAKNAGAMVLLRIYFGLGAFLTLWSLTNWLRFFTNMTMTPSLLTTFLTGLVLPVCFLVAGILYFSQSERVKAIYGSKLF